MVIILMGVTSSGKTTVGRLLAKALGYQFYDADDFHPGANIDKMRQSIPLNDADRQPWLETLRNLVRRCLAEHTEAVLACSALKESYRRYLLIDPQVRLSYLRADQELSYSAGCRTLDRLKGTHREAGPVCTFCSLTSLATDSTLVPTKPSLLPRLTPASHTGCTRHNCSAQALEGWRHVFPVDREKIG